MLADMHLRNVRQKLMLKKRTEEAVQRLQVIVVVYHRNISNKPKLYSLYVKGIQCQYKSGDQNKSLLTV